MGAQDFSSSARGKTAKEAFRTAREDAKYESGHGGYTGTIAEKHDFKLFTLPEGVTSGQLEGWCSDWSCENKDKVPQEHHALIKKMVAIYDDKWGPAICIKVDDEIYDFFGIASS